MNRRSMLKTAALGAPAALIATSEVHAQEQEARPERPTPVVNARDRNRNPIPLSIQVDGHVVSTNKGQNWDYRFAESITELTLLGKLGWEAVGIRNDGKILCKKPA